MPYAIPIFLPGDFTNLPEENIPIEQIPPSAIGQNPAGPSAPQLTPVQQRFIAALGEVPPPEGAAPYTQVPSTGAPAMQGISGPGYAAAYQPAQSFNDPAYQQKLYEWEQEVRRTAEAARAEQAIQSGIRYIYQRRYDQDLKSGVPESTAFSRMMLGIAMHGPKTDPIKAYEAFRARPAPQAQMMQFGTNQVPVIINTDRYGGQRATPVPQSALPQPPLGTNVEVFKHPVTGAELATGIPTGPRSRQLVGKAEEVKEQPFKLIEFRKLLDREEEVRKEISFYEGLPELEKEEKELLKRKKAELDAIAQQKTSLRPSAAPQAPKAESKRIRVISPDGKTGTVSETNLEEALKAGYKRQ